MTRFSNFTDEELDAIESAFCNEGLKYLVAEVRNEVCYREIKKAESEDKRSRICGNCKLWRKSRK